MRILLQALGWLLIGSAALFVIGSVEVARTDNLRQGTFGVVFFSLIGLGGYRLLRRGRRMKNAATVAAATTIERRVLTIARASFGRVTAVSVAADGGVTVEEAKAELERLAKSNACLMEVSPDGLVEFRFPEFERARPTLPA